MLWSFGKTRKLSTGGRDPRFETADDPIIQSLPIVTLLPSAARWQTIPVGHDANIGHCGESSTFFVNNCCQKASTCFRNRKST